MVIKNLLITLYLQIINIDGLQDFLYNKITKKTYIQKRL